MCSQGFKTDALGNRIWVRDPNVVDGVDRARYMAYDAATGQLTTTGLGGAGCGTPGATQYSCHSGWYAHVDTVTYDASGNQEATYGKTTQPDHTQLAQESRSYYGADEKLMYFDRHDGWGTPGLPSGVFEEYRYDALGRRVFVHSRRPSSCSYPCEAFTARTVYDGDQVLYDIRASSLTNYTEGDGSAGPGEDQNLFGVVAYAHGPAGMDQPVGVLKGTPGGWYYVTPHQNWQGEWNHGSTSSGTLCLSPGTACPSWPGDRQTADGGGLDGLPPQYTVWFGNIIQGSGNGSGQQYLRNRYYDATRGRFTQLDPIGLAGGMNLYGFASGDPVNFSDPFGLCPGVPGTNPNTVADCPGYWTSVFGFVGAMLGSVGGGGAGALACAPTVVGSIPCALAGGTAGALKGAAIGLAVGAAVDITIAKMASAGKGRGGNSGDNALVRRIAEETGLNRSGRDALHRAISRQGLEEGEIREIAKELYHNFTKFRQ